MPVPFQSDSLCYQQTFVDERHQSYDTIIIVDDPKYMGRGLLVGEGGMQKNLNDVKIGKGA